MGRGLLVDEEVLERLVRLVHLQHVLRELLLRVVRGGGGTSCCPCGRGCRCLGGLIGVVLGEVWVGGEAGIVVVEILKGFEIL